MKGHRFYEILEAHRKGEDLSVFVPTNPAEAELLANLAGGTGGKQSKIIGKTHTPVPNSDYVQSVYLNTSLSNEEVVEILSQLTYTPNGNRGLDVYYVFRAEGGMGQTWAVYRKDGEYSIGNDTEGECFFASSIDVNINSEPYNNFEGFEPGIKNKEKSLNIYGEVVDTHYTGASVGTENDKLAKLFSIDPFVKASAIPNTGHVDRIYFWNDPFNDLSQLILYASSMGIAADSDYHILVTEDKSNVIVLNYTGDGQEGSEFAIKNTATGEYYCAYGTNNTTLAGFSGWNPNISFYLGIDINANVVSEIEKDGETIPVGNHNNEYYLFECIAHTKVPVLDEIETLEGDYDGETLIVEANGEIDVKELLSNKKLPLKIVVNVIK